jgi:hypothetical protein
MAESQVLGSSEQSFVILRRVGRNESLCGITLGVLEARQRERPRGDEPQETDDEPRVLSRFLCRRTETRGELGLWEGDVERHEASWNRAVMKGRRLWLVAAGHMKLGAA